MRSKIFCSKRYESLGQRITQALQVLLMSGRLVQPRLVSSFLDRSSGKMELIGGLGCS